MKVEVTKRCVASVTLNVLCIMSSQCYSEMLMSRSEKHAAMIFS